MLKVSSVRKCDVHLWAHMFSNIALCGGNSMMPGVADRFNRMVEDQCGNRFKVIAAPDRNNAAWIGGSIIGSLSTFQQISISRQEYEECGKQIVHTKCFM